MTSLLLAAVALASVAPGPWSGGGTHGAAHARVRFDVGAGGELIQPFVRVDLRRCRSTRTVHLRRSFGLVRVSGARFSVRSTFKPHGRAMRVRLRFAGVFRSPVAARGTLRGRIRYAGGHICRIPRLTWTAHPTGGEALPPADDPTADDETFIEDDDGTIEDGDYVEDDPGDDGDGSDEEPDDDDDPDDDDPDDGP